MSEFEADSVPSKRDEYSLPPPKCKILYTKVKTLWGRGQHSKEVVYLLLNQQPRVPFPAFPKNFAEEKIIVVA